MEAAKENSNGEFLVPTGIAFPMLVSLIEERIMPCSLASYLGHLILKIIHKKIITLINMLGLETSHCKTKFQALCYRQMACQICNSFRKNTKIVKEYFPKIEGPAEWIMAIKT